MHISQARRLHGRVALPSPCPPRPRPPCPVSRRREEHHILTLTCERKVSTILQIYTQLQAPVYAAASAARQGCERSISGAPSRTPNTVSLMSLYIISTSAGGVWSLNRVTTIAATLSGDYGMRVGRCGESSHLLPIRAMHSSQDRRNLANKCGTTNGVESPSTMVDGIGNVIVARRLRSVLLLLLVAVVVATDGRL